MCNAACLDFVSRALSAGEVAGMRVLEVGSQNVNGSPRSVLEPLQPATYTGVDLFPGDGVDEVLDADRVVERFGPKSFDVVVSTEMVEHVRDWRAVFNNLKDVCADGGSVIVTTRSPGFPYHGWPHDHWRYTESDMRMIFADWEVSMLESDGVAPGVFVKARRTPTTDGIDLDAIALHSVLTGSRELTITDADLRRFLNRGRKFPRVRRKLGPVKRRLLKVLPGTHS